MSKPVVHEPAKKSVVVSTRLTAQDAKALEVAAQQHALAPSTFQRLIIEQYLQTHHADLRRDVTLQVGRFKKVTR